jgi:hypothetical protein
VEFEGPPRSRLQAKVLPKFTREDGSLLLIVEQNLFDLNFSGAAFDLSNNGRHGILGGFSTGHFYKPF